MEFALGVKAMPEDQFWRSTPYGLSCAYIGHCKANSVGRWERKADGWTDVEIDEFRAEVERAQAEFEAEQKARGPRKTKKVKSSG